MMESNYRTDHLMLVEFRILTKMYALGDDLITRYHIARWNYFNTRFSSGEIMRSMDGIDPEMVLNLYKKPGLYG